MAILEKRQRMGVAALILAGSALLSRLMGLARDKIISWQFGATHEADMYFAAFVVPDIINYLLAGGFMSITLIPLLGRGFQEDEANTWRFFSCIFIWMLTASCLLTLAGELFAPQLAHLVAPGFEAAQAGRLAAFMRIILPGQIFFLTGACFTALLFLRRQFTAPALSPLIYNGCIIMLGVGLPLLPGIAPDFGMTGYCAGAGIGAFLGAFALPLFAAARGGIKLSPVLWHPWLWRYLAIALPLMLGQTIVMLDEQFLRIFGSMLPEGNVSLLNYGRRIAQVPVSLMGQAIAVASYPFLVKLLAEHEYARFDETLNGAIKAALALLIPCAACMIAAAAPIMGIIFEGGRFGPAETAACAPLTRIMLAATPAWIIYMVLARAFYAREDTITPAVTGTIVTLVAIPCYYFIATPMGALAIAATSSLCLMAYVAWLICIWIKRHGSGAFAGLGALALRACAASLPAGAAAWIACAACLNYSIAVNSLLAYCLAASAAACVFAIVFASAAALVWPDIFAQAARMVRRKHS